MLIFDVLWTIPALKSDDARDEYGTLGQSMLVLIETQHQISVDVYDASIEERVADRL